MTSKQRKFVSGLRNIEFSDDIKQLIEIIDYLEALADMRPPVGMDHVIRVQGAHDSLIPNDKEIK